MFKDRYIFDSVTVAAYIAAYANAERYSINITKIQKLLYVAYGANLVLNQCRLCGEYAHAWPYGPVFPKTRTALLHADLPQITFADSRVSEYANDETLADIVKFTFEGFGDRTAAELTAWSHRPGSPWDMTVQQPGFNWGDEIPDAFIYDYFNKKITRDNG